MSTSLKKVWDVFSTILVALIVILALLLVGVRLFGFKVYTVLSGSMEPTYHTGSLIYVKSVEYTELKPGDPITFMLDEKTVATHRIVMVVPDETDSSVLRFQTKGDANEGVDGGLVHYKNIIGMPVFTIPLLGYVANYIQNPPGLYISIAFAAVLLLLVFLPDLMSDDDKKSKKTNNASDVDSADDPNASTVKPVKEKTVKSEKHVSNRMRSSSAAALPDVEKHIAEEGMDFSLDISASIQTDSEKYELTEMDILNAELEEILGKRD